MISQLWASSIKPWGNRGRHQNQGLLFCSSCVENPVYLDPERLYEALYFGAMWHSIKNFSVSRASVDGPSSTMILKVWVEWTWEYLGMICQTWCVLFFPCWFTAFNRKSPENSMVSIFNKTLLNDLKLIIKFSFNAPIMIVRELGQDLCLSHDGFPGRIFESFLNITPRGWKKWRQVPVRGDV